MAIKYTVKTGDNPSTIAQKIYGSQRFFNLIQQAAGGAILQAGMVLRLPDNVNTTAQGIRQHYVGPGAIRLAQENAARMGRQSTLQYFEQLLANRGVVGPGAAEGGVQVRPVSEDTFLQQQAEAQTRARRPGFQSRGTPDEHHFFGPPSGSATPPRRNITVRTAATQQTGRNFGGGNIPNTAFTGNIQTPAMQQTGRNFGGAQTPLVTLTGNARTAEEQQRFEQQLRQRQQVLQQQQGTQTPGVPFGFVDPASFNPFEVTSGNVPPAAGITPGFGVSPEPINVPARPSGQGQSGQGQQAFISNVATGTVPEGANQGDPHIRQQGQLWNTYVSLQARSGPRAATPEEMQAQQEFRLRQQELILEEMVAMMDDAIAKGKTMDDRITRLLITKGLYRPNGTFIITSSGGTGYTSYRRLGGGGSYSFPGFGGRVGRGGGLGTPRRSVDRRVDRPIDRRPETRRAGFGLVSWSI